MPVSLHETDQVVQGPCYIFATLAALESKAIQHGANATDATRTNFYEWLFYSSGVLDGTGNWADEVMIRKTLKHMVNTGAKNRPGHENPDRNQLPNLHWRESEKEELTGLAHFESSPNANPGEFCVPFWWNSFGDYHINSDGACEDIRDENSEYSMPMRFSTTPGTVAGTPEDHYKLTPPPGWSESVYYKREEAKATNAERHEQIEDVLKNEGVGVIAVFKSYHNQNIEHSIFIYKKSGTNYWFKDSWPTGSHGANPVFIKPDMPGVSLPIGDLKRIYYIPGTVENQAPVSPPDNTGCGYQISNHTLVKGETTFELVGSSAVISDVNWSVTGNLQIVSEQGTCAVVVESTNCGFLSTSATISVTYKNGSGTTCTDSHTVTASGRMVAAPSSIQINGPITGDFDEVCPGSVIQLQAISSSNLPYPETYYEWEVTGAIILNGQGTPFINILVSGASTSSQYYKVRAKDDACNNISGWRTLSGTVLASNCFPGGGGVGIFPSVAAKDDEINFSHYFEIGPDKSSVNVYIYSIDGRVLMETKATNIKPVLSLLKVPSGVVVVRMHNPDTGEFKSFKHIIAR
ncbi:MAG: hypothetical protein HEP71_26620 [Roseivirga sp.]|nr:hypothetical protein [Roseivirga sp.]